MPSPFDPVQGLNEFQSQVNQEQHAYACGFHDGEQRAMTRMSLEAMVCASYPQVIYRETLPCVIPTNKKLILTIK